MSNLWLEGNLQNRAFTPAKSALSIFEVTKDTTDIVEYANEEQKRWVLLKEVFEIVELIKDALIICAWLKLQLKTDTFWKLQSLKTAFLALTLMKKALSKLA